MPDVLFVQILDGIVAALNTDRPEDVPVVTKRRSLPGEKLSAARMAVFLGDENVDPARGQSSRDPIARRRLAIAVQCAAPTDDITKLDEIVAPMLNWATKVLGRFRVNGLVHYLRETGTQRSPEYLDLATMTATQIYECSYQTLRDDQTVRS